MKKEVVKTYELVLKNLHTAPLAVAKSILPVGVSGKVYFKGSNHVKLAKTLHEKGTVEIVQGLTDEIRTLFGWGIAVPVVNIVDADVPSVASSIQVEEAPEEISSPEIEVEPLTAEQIEAMSKEDMMEYARHVPGLDIGKRTPFDVAQARLKAYFKIPVSE